jgi:hypothetical protein
MQKPPETPTACMNTVSVGGSSDEDGADEQDLSGKGDQRGCRDFDRTHEEFLYKREPIAPEAEVRATTRYLNCIG